MILVIRNLDGKTPCIFPLYELNYPISNTSRPARLKAQTIREQARLPAICFETRAIYDLIIPWISFATWLNLTEIFGR